MTTYTINTSSMKIQAFEGTPKQAALEFRFKTEADLARLLEMTAMAGLVRCWNENQASALGDGAMPMKRFQNREIAIRRLFALAGQMPTAPAEKAQSELTAADAPANSKKALVLEMLRQPGGASASAIQSATGWQPHTVRGFIAGTVTKKLGLKVESTKDETGGRRYQVKGA